MDSIDIRSGSVKKKKKSSNIDLNGNAKKRNHLISNQRYNSVNPEQVTVAALHLPIKKPSDAYLSINSITKISEEPNLESDM